MRPLRLWLRVTGMVIGMCGIILGPPRFWLWGIGTALYLFCVWCPCRYKNRPPTVVGADSPLHEAAIRRCIETGKAVYGTYDEHGNIKLEEWDGD